MNRALIASGLSGPLSVGGQAGGGDVAGQPLVRGHLQEIASPV